jgi:hypothetical protein
MASWYARGDTLRCAGTVYFVVKPKGNYSAIGIFKHRDGFCASKPAVWKVIGKASCEGLGLDRFTLSQ